MPPRHSRRSPLLIGAVVSLLLVDLRERRIASHAIEASSGRRRRRGPAHRGIRATNVTAAPPRQSPDRAHRGTERRATTGDRGAVGFPAVGRRRRRDPGVGALGPPSGRRPIPKAEDQPAAATGEAAARNARSGRAPSPMPASKPTLPGSQCPRGGRTPNGLQRVAVRAAATACRGGGRRGCVETPGPIPSLRSRGRRSARHSRAPQTASSSGRRHEEVHPELGGLEVTTFCPSSSRNQSSRRRRRACQRVSLWRTSSLHLTVGAASQVSSVRRGGRSRPRQTQRPFDPGDVALDQDRESQETSADHGPQRRGRSRAMISAGAPAAARASAMPSRKAGSSR